MAGPADPLRPDRTHTWDAPVVEAVFDGAGEVWFALGSGEVVAGSADKGVQAHAGATLAAVAHPSGAGVITVGDDGRAVLTDHEGPRDLFARPGRWIDAVAASPQSGLLAFATGREVHVRSLAETGFERRFDHPRSVAALAFDAKGRRLAAATYGGVALWYARVADQTPSMLKWAGSHIGVAFSPDGRFVVSSMQENALHGWRLADGKDMRMGGYPTKVRSLAFLAKGKMLATSGADGAVLWPFAGSDGPMGKSAAEVAWREGAPATRVAAAPALGIVAIGRADGSVQAAELAGSGVREIALPTGAPVGALALSADGRRLAVGDEGGCARLFSL